MTHQTWSQRKLKQFQDDPEFLTEVKILEFNELLLARMEERGISRTDLAKRLGVSKPLITKVLGGNQNMTIRTMVTFAAAIGCELGLDIYSRGVKVKSIYFCERDDYNRNVVPSSEGVDHASAA